MASPAARYFTRERALVQIYGKTGELSVSLKNLSKTGACLEWLLEGLSLTKGDLIRLTVELKHIRKKHQLSAEVVWKDGHKTGVSFLNSEKLIEKMIGKNL
jgi:PilZ domain